MLSVATIHQDRRGQTRVVIGPKPVAHHAGTTAAMHLWGTARARWCWARPPNRHHRHHSTPTAHKELLRTPRPPTVEGACVMRMEERVFKMAVTPRRIVTKRWKQRFAESDSMAGAAQANIAHLATAKKLGMSMDNVVTTVAGHGNTQPPRCTGVRCGGARRPHQRARVLMEALEAVSPGARRLKY